jgi:hypothetical protein
MYVSDLELVISFAEGGLSDPSTLLLALPILIIDNNNA